MISRDRFIEHTKEMVFDVDRFRNYVRAGKKLTAHIEQFVKQDFVMWVRYEDLYNVPPSQARDKLTEICEFLRIGNRLPADRDDEIYDRFLPRNKGVDGRTLRQIKNLAQIEDTFNETIG